MPFWIGTVKNCFKNFNRYPPTMSAANLKWHINLYFNPNSLPVSASGNLTEPPPPLLPFYPLAAPTNTLVSLLHSWWKPQCCLKALSYVLFFHSSLCNGDAYRHESGRCRTLHLFLIFFYHFTFPGFPFILYLPDWLGRKGKWCAKILNLAQKGEKGATPTWHMSTDGFPPFSRIQ